MKSVEQLPYLFCSLGSLYEGEFLAELLDFIFDACHLALHLFHHSVAGRGLYIEEAKIVGISFEFLSLGIDLAFDALLL